MCIDTMSSLRSRIARFGNTDQLQIYVHEKGKSISLKKDN